MIDSLAEGGLALVRDIVDVLGDAAPEVSGGGGRLPRRVRVAQVVSAKEGFLEEIEVIAGRDTDPLWGWRELEDLRRRIAGAAERVGEQCRRKGISPGELPLRSRRAYQLLSYLGSDGTLPAHLQALRIMRQADGRVEARLDHGPYLYRYERSAEGIVLHASEGFVGAPEAVFRSLVHLAVPHTRKRTPREIVRAYSDGPLFAATMQALESSGGVDGGQPRGDVFDLAQVFEDVNRAYFRGRLMPPRLRWSERKTYREFGHYEPATDTVLLSRTLDSEEVPPFVVEHVMHHELLHRWIGAEESGGRRRYHSARFRRAELAFARYREAEAFLRRLAGSREPSGLR